MSKLKERLDELSKKANPGPYGVESYQSGTTYLKLGSWVGHYAGKPGPNDEYIPPFGYGRAQIINSNVPSEWGDSPKKEWTAAFLAELANAYRDGLLVCREATQ